MDKLIKQNLISLVNHDSFFFIELTDTRYFYNCLYYT